MDNLRIIQTEDGSSSLMHTGLNETYHSIHGAIQESRHVFIEAGLNKLLLNSRINNISVLEVGFGTGLNALLTLLMTKSQGVQVTYTAIETFPLSLEILSLLNYSSVLEATIEFQSIHQGDWNVLAQITENFFLEKQNRKIQDAVFEKRSFDLIYFDAFAPSKQPEMWELPILKKIVEAMKPNGIFVTYSAKGQLKRDLVSLGLSVEKIPGPTGKREMIRAIKS